MKCYTLFITIVQVSCRLFLVCPWWFSAGAEHPAMSVEQCIKCKYLLCKYRHTQTHFHTQAIIRNTWGRVCTAARTKTISDGRLVKVRQMRLADIHAQGYTKCQQYL